MAHAAITPVAVDVFLLILATLAIVLRFISRKWSKAKLWWDDWFALAALPFCFGTCIPFTIAAYHGFGQHNGDPTVFFHGLYFAELWYNLAITLVKLSVVCFYARVFAMTRWSGYILWAIGLFATSIGVSLATASIFQCTPIKRYWNPTLPGHCVYRYGYFIGQAIPDIVCDFVLLLLPLWPLWKLKMKSRQKMGLVLVFTLGYLNPLISILRLVSFVQLGPNPTSDFNYIFVAPALWSGAEVAIGIFSCSIPSQTFLFRRLLGTCFPSINNSTAKQSYGQSRSDIRTNSNFPAAKRSKLVPGGSFEQLCDEPHIHDGTNQYAVNQASAENGPAHQWNASQGSFPLQQIMVTDEVNVSYGGKIPVPPPEDIV